MKYLWIILTMWTAYYGRIDICLADDNCEGKFKNCCDGFMFDFQTNKCIACKIGFFDVNCSKTCPNGTFGKDCQSVCRCYPCHHADGCTEEIVKDTLSAEYRKEMVTHFKKMISSYQTSSTPKIHWVSKSQLNSTEKKNKEEPEAPTLHHGLYVIVSTNTLLTLPITVAVILYICRKRKSRKTKQDTVEEIYYHANPDTCYNDLNEIRTVTKACEYDALPVDSEDFGNDRLCLDFLDDVQRKTRANSYVPVRERKPKENDERNNERDHYTKVKKNFSRTEATGNMTRQNGTTESLDSQTSVNTTTSSAECQYVVPLTPTAAGPGISFKSSDDAYLSVPMEDAETMSNGSVVYTELI